MILKAIQASFCPNKAGIPMPNFEELIGIELTNII